MILIQITLACLAVGFVVGIEGSRRKWPTFVTFLVGGAMGGVVALCVLALGKAAA